MLLELLTLANTPPADNSAAIITGFVVAVIGAVFAGLANLKGRRDGRSERMTIEQQPLSVKMEDHFVTRREFDSFKGEIRTDVAEMKGLFRETMSKIEERDRSLTEKIEKAAKTGVDGRVAIWNQIREDEKSTAAALTHQGERIAKVEAGVDIAGRFERAAAEVLKKPTRGQ